uniref:Uncharacterized protein n=1 Tax=Triticum urartu TaxID=4572 RepID=A0A8R7QR55_TRIUA
MVYYFIQKSGRVFCPSTIKQSINHYFVGINSTPTSPLVHFSPNIECPVWLSHRKKHHHQHVVSMNTGFTVCFYHPLGEFERIISLLKTTKHLKKAIVSDNVRRKPSLPHLFQNAVGSIKSIHQAHAFNQIFKG